MGLRTMARGDWSCARRAVTKGGECARACFGSQVVWWCLGRLSRILLSTSFFNPTSLMQIASTHRTKRRCPPQNLQQRGQQLLIETAAPVSLPARGRRRRRRRHKHRYQRRLPLWLEETGLHAARRRCRPCGAIGSGGGEAVLRLVVLGGGRRSLLLLLVVGEPHRHGVERRDLYFD